MIYRDEFAPNTMQYLKFITRKSTNQKYNDRLNSDSRRKQHSTPDANETESFCNMANCIQNILEWGHYIKVYFVASWV